MYLERFNTDETLARLRAKIDDCECGCNTNSGLDFHQDMDWEGHNVVFWVSCPKCGRTSDSSPNPEMAVEDWNEWGGDKNEQC